MIIGVSGLNDAYKQANREAQKKYGDQLTRGHMNPSGINSFDKTYMKNTFTLGILYLSLRHQTADLGMILRIR